MNTSSRRRVVVTGIGWITPFGHDIETVWRRLIAGECAIDRITVFDASAFPTQIAAEVRDFDFAAYVDDPDVFEHAGRTTRFVVAASTIAMKDARLDPGSFDPARRIDSVDRPQSGKMRQVRPLRAGLPGHAERACARIHRTRRRHPPGPGRRCTA